MATLASAGAWRPQYQLYALVGVEYAIALTVALLIGFRVSNPYFLLPQLWCVALIACGPLARRIGYDQLGDSCEAVGLLYGQGFALVPLVFVATAFALPFADGLLASMDRALGFEWMRFAMAFRNDEALIVARTVYGSFAWQAAIILPVLIYTGLQKRAWQLVLAANLTLIPTVLIYPFLPAEGTFAHFGLTEATYSHINAAAWSFGPAIEAIRDGGARLITRDLLAGYISFPSYHAAAAVLFAWGAWRTVLRLPFLLLNLLMAGSALLVGGHYLVDLLGGFAIGAAMLMAVQRFAGGDQGNRTADVTTEGTRAVYQA